MQFKDGELRNDKFLITVVHGAGYFSAVGVLCVAAKEATHNTLTQREKLSLLTTVFRNLSFEVCRLLFVDSIPIEKLYFACKRGMLVL